MALKGLERWSVLAQSLRAMQGESPGDGRIYGSGSEKLGLDWGLRPGKPRGIMATRVEEITQRVRMGDGRGEPRSCRAPTGVGQRMSRCR